MYFETVAGDDELVVEWEKKSKTTLDNNEEESYLRALELHEELNGGYSARSVNKSELSVIDRRWELVDPTPDITQLFVQFNTQFFHDQLAAVFVEWSQRMTSCAGICVYESRGQHCRIALSEPLLKLRPRKDLVQTLLHEMIHAYLFVTENRKDRNGHGPEFLKHMVRINEATGANITIYHTFLDEVDHYRQHWWRCTGLCRQWKPFYGYVKRAMNRAPSKNDRWFAEHERRCKGQFIKIKEPQKHKRPNINSQSSSEPPTKKAKALPIDQSALDKFIFKPTAWFECPLCRETIHRTNRQMHRDIKCPMREK